MNGIANVISNFASLLDHVHYLILGGTIMFGVILALYGLIMLGYDRQHVSGGRSSKVGAVTSITVGSLMASMTYFMGVLTDTLFMGQSPRTPLSYSVATSGDATEAIIKATLSFAAVFGWYWVAKGCFLVHRSGHPHLAEKQDRMRGLIRIGAGTLAANMLHVTNLIAAAGGFSNPIAI